MRDVYQGYIKKDGKLVPHAANVDGVRIELEDVWRQSGAGLSFDDWIAGMLRRAAIVAGGLGNVGEIFWWPLEVPPDDALFCDGRAVSREEYSDLFGVIGTDFGAGDGSTTFNLPDMRGQFVRGFDPTNERDPQGGIRGFGSAQGATGVINIQTWRGASTAANQQFFLYPRANTNNTGFSQTNSDGTILTSNGRAWAPASSVADDAQVAIHRVRPTNINLLPCIRFKVMQGEGGGLREIPDPLTIDNFVAFVSAIVPTMPRDDKSTNAASTQFVHDAIDAEMEGLIVDAFGLVSDDIGNMTGLGSDGGLLTRTPQFESPPDENYVRENLEGKFFLLETDEEANCAGVADGREGRKVLLRSDGNYIQWQHEGDYSWQNLVPLSEIRGPDGEPGPPGKPGERGERGINNLIVSTTAIQPGSPLETGMLYVVVRS